MPNHYTTVGICARDWERIEHKGIEDEEIDYSPLEGANLCSLLHPMPSALEGIQSASPDRYRLVHRDTKEIHKGDALGLGDDWERIVLLDEEVASLREKYGAADWYEWCPKNWGTKWGTYDTKAIELVGDGSPAMIEFASAWSPPNSAMMQRIDNYLCETYCLKNIEWVGHNPSNNSVTILDIWS